MTDAEWQQLASSVFRMRERVRWMREDLESQGDEPDTETQAFVEGFDALNRLVALKHLGAMQERRKYNVAEDVFASEWVRANARGMDTLSLLLDDVVSPRDAYVAATIVQWLGTNIGSEFINSCRSKIKHASAQRTENHLAADILLGKDGAR